MGHMGKTSLNKPSVNISDVFIPEPDYSPLVKRPLRNNLVHDATGPRGGNSTSSHEKKRTSPVTRPAKHGRHACRSGPEPKRKHRDDEGRCLASIEEFDTSGANRSFFQPVYF